MFGTNGVRIFEGDLMHGFLTLENQFSDLIFKTLDHANGNMIENDDLVLDAFKAAIVGRILS